MATLYIAEYGNAAEFTIVGQGEAGSIPIVAEPPLAEQTVAIAGASAQSSAFGATTKIIRVHTDAICSILIGANPIATAVKKRLAADQTEYFAVTPAHKIAVISNT